MRLVRHLAPLLLAALLLAGCSSGPAPSSTTTTSATVVTDPAAAVNASDGSHIHDYWGGRDRLTFIDATHPGGDEPGTGPGFATGSEVVVRSFQPDPGNVVPQGTASVEVTLSWTPDSLDSYRDPVLWLKTAGTNATEQVAVLENGVPVTVETGAPDADLPHQLVSAWLFELRMSSPDPMPLRFKGAVSLKADAIRGLPLPVYPPHPDPWNGSTELPLFAASGSLSYFEDLGDQGCNGADCPVILRPDLGHIVPADATAVQLDVTWSNPAFTPQLLYHDALSRDFVAARTPSPQGTLYAFDIPVDGKGDSPYAAQSLWEFKLVPQPIGPLRTAWAVDYSVDAIVQR